MTDTKPKKTKYPEVNIGDVFTRLTVIGDREIIDGYKKRLCECSCGSVPKRYMELHLKSQNTKSCGCLAREGIKVRGENRKPRKKQQNQIPCVRCQQPCLHKSGHCSECRSVTCTGCKDKFMVTFIGQKVCAHCAKAKSRPARSEW